MPTKSIEHTMISKITKFIKGRGKRGCLMMKQEFQHIIEF